MDKVLILIMSVLTILFVIFSILAIDSKPRRKQTKEEYYQQLRAKFMNKNGLTDFGVHNFGVHNHGVSLDDVNKIQVISPSEMGVGQKNNEKREI